VKDSSPWTMALVLPRSAVITLTANKPQCVQYEQDFALTPGRRIRIPLSRCSARPPIRTARATRLPRSGHAGPPPEGGCVDPRRLGSSRIATCRCALFVVVSLHQCVCLATNRARHVKACHQRVTPLGVHGDSGAPFLDPIFSFRLKTRRSSLPTRVISTGRRHIHYRLSLHCEYPPWILDAR